MFAYDDAVTRRFPTIRAAVVHATGLANGPSSLRLLDEVQAEARAALQRLHETAISDLPSIAAWRRVFTGFGAKPTQYRNAAEALLRRLAKHDDIPDIGTLVEVGNLVSVRYAMPVAVLDLAAITGRITVRVATGTERFTDLGSSSTVAPEPGEVIFVDTADVVSARRWCWRQSAQSATSASTRDALFVVEGTHATAGDDVRSALGDLMALLRSYQPGCELTPYLLTPANPSTDGGPARVSTPLIDT